MGETSRKLRVAGIQAKYCGDWDCQGWAAGGEAMTGSQDLWRKSDPKASQILHMLSTVLPYFLFAKSTSLLPKSFIFVTFNHRTRF